MFRSLLDSHWTLNTYFWIFFFKKSRVSVFSILNSTIPHVTISSSSLIWNVTFIHKSALIKSKNTSSPSLSTSFTFYVSKRVVKAGCLLKSLDAIKPLKPRNVSYIYCIRLPIRSLKLAIVSSSSSKPMRKLFWWSLSKVALIWLEPCFRWPFSFSWM